MHFLISPVISLALSLLFISSTAYQLPIEAQEISRNPLSSAVVLEIFPKLIQYATEKAIITLNDLVTEIELADSEFTQFIEGLGKVDFVFQNSVIKYVNASQYLSYTKLEEGSLFINVKDVTFSFETDMRCLALSNCI
jgi:hypothetical protein